mmetsp:Transcript_113039/g.314621  ORF Transcript_113039/g.314621 Transcript_113039/m.314621 type:complete len:209 (+) Transcript_113039:773-1399(+)
MTLCSRNRGTRIRLPYTSSSATCCRLENGESRTQAARFGSSAARSTVVAAPIDLPQTATALTESKPRRYSTTVRRSRCSWWPKEMYSPSDRPEPEKSKQKTVMFLLRSTSIASKASSRHDELPWQYTTHGSLELPRGRKWLHSSAWPRSFLRRRSFRSKSTESYVNSRGPSSSTLYTSRGGRMIISQSSLYASEINFIHDRMLAALPV